MVALAGRGERVRRQIGRYEGGMYATKGVWRPSEHSMMKTLGYAYDQVARERTTQAIVEKLSCRVSCRLSAR